jgi:hypothetical protein
VEQRGVEPLTSALRTRVSCFDRLLHFPFIDLTSTKQPSEKYFAIPIDSYTFSCQKFRTLFLQLSQRHIGFKSRALPNLTKQYKPVFTLLAVVKVLEVQLIESYDPSANLSNPDNAMVFDGTLPSPRSAWLEQLRNPEKLKSTSTTLDASTT